MSKQRTMPDWMYNRYVRMKIDQPPKWCKNAVPSDRGWVNPKTGELLVGRKGLKRKIEEFLIEKEIRENELSVNEAREEVLTEEPVETEEKTKTENEGSEDKTETETDETNEETEEETEVSEVAVSDLVPGNVFSYEGEEISVKFIEEASAAFMEITPAEGEPFRKKKTTMVELVK